MLPIFDYGRQIIHTDVKKQGLPQMSANRPSIWFTGIELFFAGQVCPLKKYSFLKTSCPELFKLNS